MRDKKHRKSITWDDDDRKGNAPHYPEATLTNQSDTAEVKLIDSYIGSVGNLNTDIGKRTTSAEDSTKYIGASNPHGLNKTTSKVTKEVPIPGNKPPSSRRCAINSLMTVYTPDNAAITQDNKNTTNSASHRHFSHRKTTNVATYNVRTLRRTNKDGKLSTPETFEQSERFHQLIYGCEDKNIDIVAVQEHRLPASDNINTYTETYNNKEWRSDYCSATKTSQGNHVGGIGLLTNSEAAKTMTSTTKVSDRIMKANFAGNPTTTVIVAYAPTEEKPKAEKDEFYAKLLKCAQEVPPHNMPVIAGDFNARIGLDSSILNPRAVGKHALHEKTNDNGSRLVEFCETTNTRSAQFRFPHKKSRIWTWQPDANRKENDDKNRAQLDHILISGKWENSVKNIRAYNTVDVGSDHRIVNAQIRVSLRAPVENKNKRPKYDWRKLKENNELQNKYAIAIKNHFSVLSEDEQDVQTKYDHIVATIEKAAKSTVGLIKKKAPKNWVSSRTTNLLDQRNRAKRDRKEKQECHDLSQKLLESYQQDRIAFLSEKLERLKEAAKANRLRTTWEVINEISGKTKSINKHKMKKTDGSDINSPKELLDECQNYFKTLLNNEIVTEHLHIEPATRDLEIDIGPFTFDEVKMAVDELKNGKSPGCDYPITAEALKYGGHHAVRQLCNICNDVYMQEKAPEQFTTTTSLFDLDFADDIALLEGGDNNKQQNLEKSQAQLQTTAKWAKRVGLEVNIKKTEAFSNQELAGPEMPINLHQFIELDGLKIEWTKDFKYLGSYIASSEADIRARKGQAWGAFWKMKNVFLSKTLPIKLKLNIFEAACISILLYGCESWIINQKMQNSLNSFATSCYRIMLGIKKMDRISNKAVYEAVEKNQLILQIQQRQLRFVGHSLRRDLNDQINKYVLYAPEERHGKRSRGKPRTLYHTYIGKLINNDMPPTADEMRRAASNRTEWSKLVTDCKPVLFAAD
ncbi:unnamed protein product [Leuciscus chuanchicus]